MSQPKPGTGTTGKKGRAVGSRERSEDLSSYVFGKVPPQAIPLEEAVLGAIMLEKEALPQVVDVLQAESFYLDAHQQIYRAMLRLFERSQPIDLLTVMEELKKAGELETAGGPAYLAELTNRVGSAANIEYHARLVAQKHIQRELIRVSTQTIKEAFEDTTDVFELLDEAEQGLFGIAQKNMGRTVDHMGTLANRLLKQLEQLKETEEGLTGVPTGFTEFDRLTSGLQRSDLIIIAARPGMGKTALVLSLAKNAAVDFKKPVAIFSLEMSSLQLAQRIIAMEAEIQGGKMRNAKLEDYEWQQLHSAIERIADAPIFIDDTPGINIFELRAKCRRLKLQHDIQLVIIDYLQLMSGGGDNQKGNREQEVSAISRALKSLAKELNVPVIALSQLSRAVEVRGGSKRPQLSDLRESGCLTGDTLLQNAETGELVSIRELAEREVQAPWPVLAMDEQYRLRRFDLEKAFYSGKKEIFELRTRSGRSIKASANHPFRVLEGWKRLDLLSVGDRLATPRIVNIDSPTNPLSDDSYHVKIHGVDMQLSFLEKVGCFGERGKIVPEIITALKQIVPNTNVDTIPAAVWRLTIKPYLREKGISQRQFCRQLGLAESGSRFSNSISRQRLDSIASKLDNDELKALANSDIFWDEITDIIPLGIEDVYDATVPGVHNFVANNIVVHNSIEQDADMVAFIYRPEYYQIMEDEEGQSLKGVAEVIVAKHRHGALKTVRLRFTDEFARFSNLDDPDFGNLPGDAFDQPYTSIITRPSKMNEDEDIPF